MKVAKIFAGISLALNGSVALADYQCTSTDGQKTLKVYENEVTPLGGNTVVELSEDSGYIGSWGGTMSIEGELFKKKHVYFWYSPGSLVITHSPVFSPSFCGRGTCEIDPLPPQGETIYAQLVSGEKTTTFQCYETDL